MISRSSLWQTIPGQITGQKKSVSLDLADVRRIRIRALSTAGTPADTYISAAQFSLYEKYSIYDKHTYLSDLYQTPDENGNTVKENANADGTAITLKTNEKERTFEKGIGMRSGDTAVWDISGLNSDALSLWIGMNKKELLMHQYRFTATERCFTLLFHLMEVTMPFPFIWISPA